MGFEKHYVKSVHEGQKFQCPHCAHKSTLKSNLLQHIKSIHEGQKFPCSQCEYKSTKKTLLQKHVKSVHGEDKSKEDLKTLKTESSSDYDILMGEYFENDIKSELDSDIELDTSRELKNEFLSDNHNVREVEEEYFKIDVKSDIESYVELD